MQFGLGSEGIGTKSLSQSFMERELKPGELEHALERARALERALDLVSPPASPLSFSGEDEGPPSALELARALTNERAVALERTRVLQPMTPVPQNQPFALDAVTADSGIIEIINSIEPDYRYKLARVLWLHSPRTKHEYSWLFHIIAPITRLGAELLQRILLIVIDEVSDSPSVLVHVCKHWHSMVTGIWSFLKLRTETTKDDVIRQMEENQRSLAGPYSAQSHPQSIPTRPRRNDVQTSLSQSPPSPTPNARPPPQPSMQSPPTPVLETPRELFSDLTKPSNPKDFSVTRFSKKLIEWVGLDVVRVRNNHQVAYHIVDQCREAYERINDIVDEIEQSTDYEIKLSKFLKYMDAVNALEEYCFKILCSSELETTDYFATTNTIEDCIRGATSWAEQRQKLRDIASEFTTNEILLAVFEPEMRTKIERGLIDAASDDDTMVFGDLRARIEAHRMVNEVADSAVKALVRETKVAIGTLHEVIAQESDVKKKMQRQMFSIQFLFILHGAMEIVVDTLEQVNADWKAHLKSQEVWTAAKLLAEDLQKDDIKYGHWPVSYDHFLQVMLVRADFKYVKNEEIPSNYGSTGPIDGKLENYEENNTPTINDVESLRKGIIRTSKNEAHASYTILIVGETGVGKSSVLEFIANVLSGEEIDHYNLTILDRTNENVGSDNQSKTNSARLYEFTSKSGIIVRILDTPGLADTRGIEQDERHKDSIASQIKEHIDSVTAVLIVLNGTVERITVGSNYALSTLSAIFPKTFANNIAIMFTNVPSPYAWNFSQEALPRVLKDAPQFLLDNPVALKKKYLRLKDNPNMRKVQKDMRNHLKAGEQKALETLVQLFDWLDACKPQPTKEIVYLYEMSQDIEVTITDTLAQIDQGEAKKVEIDKFMSALKINSNGMNTSADFEKTVSVAVWRQQRTSTNNLLCGQINCYSNCQIDYKTNIPLDFRGFFGGSCSKCNHRLWNHHRCYSKWQQVDDAQVSIDQNMKTKWEAAKDGSERTAALVAASEKVLNDLNQVINRAINNLAQLVRRYSRLSLSGSFATQVNSAVILLEQNYTALEGNGVGYNQVQRLKDSLDRMKRKLELLNNAKTYV